MSNWLQPKQEVKLLTYGSVVKDFCQLITDLQRRKTCFREKDKLNRIIRIIKIIKTIKTIKIIKIIKMFKIVKLIQMIKIIKTIELIKSIMSCMSFLFVGQWSTNKIC